MDKILDEKTAEALKVLWEAADAAESRIEHNAASAIKVVANAAAEAQKASSISGNNDHDLLIILGERMEQLRIDIKELKSGYTGRIDDHEKRIKCLEGSQSKNDGVSGGRKDIIGWIFGGVTLLIMIVTFIITHWRA